MNIILRPIELEDYKEVISVIKKSNSVSFEKIYSKELIEQFNKKYDLENFKIKVKEIEYFIAEETTMHKILGIIGLKNNELRTFFVDPQYQNQKVGRKLFDYLENEAIKRGIKEIVTQASLVGEPIYEHFGFKKIKTTNKERNGIKYINVYMVKNL